MPKARTKNNPPPDGWELIESTLNDFDHRMRDAEMESDQGKRKVETVWPIFRIHHQRSRYIYEMYSIRHEVCNINIYTQIYYVLISIELQIY